MSDQIAADTAEEPETAEAAPQSLQALLRLVGTGQCSPLQLAAFVELWCVAR